MMNVMRNCCQRLMHGYLKRCNLTYAQKRLCSQEYSGKLMAHLQAKMKFSGPITVAEYMKEALTHATGGYYINRDVFGVKGDFITSPEISQMFGELVGIWFVNEWMMAGSPERIQLVEMGPGRGTMADDMLRKTDHGWREVLVDIDPSTDGELRFVLAPSASAASKTVLKVDPEDLREHIEVCPEGGVTVQYLANRIERDGGCALIADYGHDGENEDTLRGFKEHALHDVLVDPGTADLTADVDFAYLKTNAGDIVKSFGPVSQAHFLQNMGIAYRLKILFERADDEGKADLVSAFHKLTSAEEMGERFQFLALLNNKSSHIPVGFDPLPEETLET